jgi:NADH-quinone oxidoreductase subunit M
MVGVIYDRAHTREIPLFSGLAKRMPIASSFFIVAGLASLGLPGLSGFVAELLVFIGAFQVSFIVGALAVLGATITAVYVLRLLGTVFFGPLAQAWERLSEASPIERTSGAILVSLLVLFGVAPFLLLDVITTSIEPLVRSLS